MASVTHTSKEAGVGILLNYKGPAVDDGTMDVYSVAANMVAFSEFVVAASKHLYGEVDVRAEVRGFNRGSFETELIFHVAGLGATLLSAAPDAMSVLKVVKESLGLYKFLKGKAPEKVEHTDQSNNVSVTNVNGNVIIVQTESLNLTMDEKAGKSVGQFVATALTQPGVKTLELRSIDGGEISSAKSSDAEFFHPITDEVPVVEQVNKLGLMILEPSFKDGTGHKWTLWDGEAALQYLMEDPAFIARIDAGEAFRKNDVLICDVKVTQTRIGAKLKIARSIVKVHQHKDGHDQAEIELTP